MVRNNSKQQILEMIVDRIQYLEMKPGEIVNESALAEEMGVSRTPVRETLLLLESEGFVDIFPQRGTFVSKIDLRRVKEYLYLRATVEKTVFNELAKKKIKVFDKVEANLLIQQLAVKKQDFAGFSKNDYAMHEILFNLAGHGHIWKVISRTFMHCTRLRILGWSLSESMLNTIFTEHQAIVSFIETGDIESLDHAIDNHHDSVYIRYVREVVEKYGDYFINIEMYI